MSEYYAVIAKREGSAEAKFLHSLDFSLSPDEAMARLNARLVNDPEFRQRWNGWIFMVALASSVIRVDAEGSVFLHKNDREVLTRHTF